MAFKEFVMHEDQPQAPCIKCDDRAAGCHTTCRRYQLFRQICRAQAKKRRVELGLDEAETKRRERDERWALEHMPKKWRR